MRDSLHHAALAYAAAGYAVFPCVPRSKKPLTSNGFKDATTNTAIINGWWQKCPSANVAMAMGVKSGAWVLDVDSPEGQAWLDAQKSLPITPLQRTYKGQHLFFAMQEGQELRNTAKRVKGIDTRGNGGYIMLAPSIHPDTGKPYTWERSLLDYLLQPAPNSLIAAIYPPPKPMQPYAPCRLRDDSSGSRYGLKALENQCNTIAQAPSGTQNHALNKGTFLIGKLVGGGELSISCAFQSLVRAGLMMQPSAEVWTQAQVEKIVKAALKAGAMQPKKASPHSRKFTKKNPLAKGVQR